MTPRLPCGFAVVLDVQTRRLDAGAALLGGSPLRVLRLRPAARKLLTEQSLRVRDARTASLARSLLDAGVAHPRPAEAPPITDVTVVIPVRDHVTALERLLRALDTSVPVVVVDDGSVDSRTVQRVVARHGARLVRHARSRGPAAARNSGLGHVSTAVVAFLDVDVVPEPGWLPPLLAHLSDPAVALVAPRITALAVTRGWIARYETTRSSLDLGPREAPVVPRTRVAYVPSAALLVRVSAVQPRCFDESLRVAEDVDLCWRLHAQGWRLRYEPAVRVGHEHRTDPRKWLARKMFYGTGAAPLARRHPGQVPPVVLAPWTAAVCVLALTGRRTGLVAAGLVGAANGLRVSRALRGRDHPVGLAPGLLARAAVGAAWQVSSAAWRSYWPASLLLAAVSVRVRRALLVAGVLEGMADWAQHRDEPGGLDPVRYLAAKRLDDLAYGTGLWWGAVRLRNAAALMPSLSG